MYKNKEVYAVCILSECRLHVKMHDLMLLFWYWYVNLLFSTDITNRYITYRIQLCENMSRCKSLKAVLFSFGKMCKCIYLDILKKDIETESDAKCDFELKVVRSINNYQLLNTCSTRYRHQVYHRRETGSMRAGNSENHHTWARGIVKAKILSFNFQHSNLFKTFWTVNIFILERKSINIKGVACMPACFSSVIEKKIIPTQFENCILTYPDGGTAPWIE
jgi:hypothetical protein